MNWHPPVPLQAIDDTGRPWLVHRAWPDKTPEEYILEVRTPGRTGVRAAHFRGGRFELVPEGGDPRLAALAVVAPRGEVVVHRAHKRAVVRIGVRYFKIFRPKHAIEAGARYARMNALLGADDFLTPEVISCSSDCLTLTGIPGRSLFELGQDSTLSDDTFERIWQRWSQAWVNQQSLASRSVSRQYIEALPLRTAAVELENLERTVDLWLQHSEGKPAAESQRHEVRARSGQIAQRLRSSAPDPLTWSHGDLHDKQILVVAPDEPLGLLDFDEAGQAEAAVDLANVDVHLQLRLLQERLTPARYLAAHAQVLAAAEELHVTPARFHAYADATWLRLGCLYSFRPQWASLAAGILDERAAHRQIFSGFNTSTAMGQRPPAPRRPLELSHAMNEPLGLL